MFHWFRQISVVTRLRGLTLMAVLAMLSVAAGLLWSGYQQRLADRQAVVRQAVELAHASVQWAFAQQQIGKLNVALAHKQALAALEKQSLMVRSGQYIDDLQSALLGQTALTIGAVALVALVLWSCIEITARDMAAQVKNGAQGHLRAQPRGPQAYKQVVAGASRATDSGHPGDQGEAESATQEVSRLRMAGAI